VIPKGLPDVYLMEKDTVVLIDEGYLSSISKYFGKGKPLKSYIEIFSQKLVNSIGLNCAKIYYYTAPPYQSSKPTELENLKKAKYDQFIEKLRKVKPEIIIREGRCQKDDKGRFHQKGVDTLLTMDLLKVSMSNEFDSIILITADTDFVPIIKDIKENYKTKIILAFFTDKKRKSPFSLSNHLWQVCDKRIIIKKDYFGTTL
jgi:uncharacterized LabA/DUF88 family protein